jgi:hypothetical protein
MIDIFDAAVAAAIAKKGGGGGTSNVAGLHLEISPLTYILSGWLIDNEGVKVGTEQDIDLPLEACVVGISYDNVTKDLTLTLASGSTTTVPLDDIVYGLQPLIDSSHKLSADLVDDSASTNKLARVDSAGGLWIGSAQYIKIMDSASYEALATKEDIIYMVYPTPTPAPSLNASPRSETLDITPIEREDIRLEPMEGVETKIGVENELTVEGGDDNANLQRDNGTD